MYVLIRINSLGGIYMAETAFNKPEWFEYRADYADLIELSPNGEEVLKTFAYCIDELGTSDAIIEYIKNEIPADAGLYHDRHEPDKMEKFLKKAMKGQIAPDEKVIVYADTGLITTGKVGFIVTDKKIAFSAKKQPIVINHTDLKKIALHFGTEGCTYTHMHLNDIHAADINCIDGNSLLPYGAIAALICVYSFEQNPGRDKIIIEKFEGEE